jgi:hypothetical protein
MKKKKQPKQDSNLLPLELRGLPQNRWGGFKTRSLKPYRQNTFGPANHGRIYTEEEKQAWAAANLL